MSGTSAWLLLKTGQCALFFGILLLPHALRAQLRYVEQRTANGVLEGVVSADGKVRTFKGIPYAAPPVGPLRWKAPQPAAAWTGVRKATEYPARCMQAPIYSDMIFHDNGPSEDCLYLNLWMPAAPAQPRLPVMVWIYGGGFAAGATSEPRQDGGNLSKKGVLVVSMNYRLGIFGFFSHPALAKESGHNATGNYGLLDQVAALKWVRDNIAVFGGDPNNVTIFGESAGSFSVSALMASPLAQGLFRRAIGESGAFFGDTLRPQPRAETEKAGVEFAKSSLGTDSLEALRAKPAAEILQAAAKPGAARFVPNIDGYFLPESVEAIFAAGKQSHVPLLAGWNADEMTYRAIFGKEDPTAENFLARARALYGDQCRDHPEALSGGDGRAGQAIGARPGGGPVHRLLHLEMDGDATEDRTGSGLPLPVRADTSLGGRRGCRCGTGGSPRVGDRVRVPGAVFEKAAVAAGRPQGVGSDGLLLEQLRQDRGSQRRRPAAMAGIQPGRIPGDASERRPWRGA